MGYFTRLGLTVAIIVMLAACGNKDEGPGAITEEGGVQVGVGVAIGDDQYGFRTDGQGSPSLFAIAGAPRTRSTCPPEPT